MSKRVLPSESLNVQPAAQAAPHPPAAHAHFAGDERDSRPSAMLARDTRFYLDEAMGPLLAIGEQARAVTRDLQRLAERAGDADAAEEAAELQREIDANLLRALQRIWFARGNANVAEHRHGAPR